MKKNILLTGLPRSGKSTLLAKLILDHKKRVGFVTHEVCENGERIGFEIETSLGGKSAIANMHFETNFKVSKYFVEPSNLDFMLPRISKFGSEDLLFLDEIGQMQLLSKNFKKFALSYFDSPNICIATLSKVYNDDFTEQLRNRDDVIIIEISEANRELVEEYLRALISKIFKAKNYINDPTRFVVTNDNVSIRSDHGTRNLNKIDERWVCDCDFFKKNSICSHIIALEQHLKNENVFY